MRPEQRRRRLAPLGDPVLVPVGPQEVVLRLLRQIAVRMGMRLDPGEAFARVVGPAVVDVGEPEHRRQEQPLPAAVVVVFQVAMDANKIDIKRAVEKLLGSKVQSVRTSLAHGKMKRQGKFVGRRSDWKKAYVKLREGEKLPDFLQGA